MHTDPGDRWEGRSPSVTALNGWLATSRATAPERRFSVASMIEEGESIAVSWAWESTHMGDIPGLPETGQAHG